MKESSILIVLILFLLLVIVLQNTIFEHANSNTHSNPITIVGNVGPTTYEDGTLNIQYIGNPYVPFRNM
ncbi:hypothetical protein [Pseudalkalibacillus berkeleyi]|uniref:Uncharacterized protein n=1 Tax=Pseudalkalibacillus berkeleyi TaxID=1069813 RepID=A0ABS9GWY6_9BACL|nr:hypothetical protein [Pseudalkalibacillus berkeleyi]MCF6136336.1 hypothetical protein [Pseudalkalibacillus berkeleyi]